MNGAQNNNGYGWKEPFLTEALQYPEYALGRVVRQHKGGYEVVEKNGEGLAQVSGKLRHSITDPTQYPAVGDFVMLSPGVDGGPAMIHAVLPRQSAFERAAVGGSGGAQIVAANVDVVFLCMSLNQNYSLNRMERYLSVAWSSGATPVILLTKADLCPDVPARLAEMAQIAPYVDALALSVYDQSACQRVLGYVKPGVTASFIGSSGVGKSTLINALMGREAQTTAEIGWMDKGRHTTTAREMLALPNGSVVIDTPGMRELGADGVDLSAAFADVRALEATCRFSDCTHTNEPGCAVRRALENGELDQRRLDSYQKLSREAKYDGLNARELEAVKANDMFKEVGGMKNIRKYNRENNKRR